MKLNPEELVVSTFETSDPAAAGPIGPYDPTPMTYCYWCPPRTIGCPVGTDPGTIVVVE